MIHVRELTVKEFDRATAALLDLRPQHETAERVAAVITTQAEDGYRIVAAFDDDRTDAVTVAGFRFGTNLPWGSYCYVDDFNTLSQFRGRGAGTGVLARVIEIAREEGAANVHLDSGAGAHRFDAHALYFRLGLRITSHHFGMNL